MHRRIAFLAALTSVALMTVAGPASASVPTLPLLAGSAFVEEAEEEEEPSEEEEELETCEEEPQECEEAEEPASEAGAKPSGPSAECPLRKAKAHAVAKNGKLKLTIGYTTNEPFDATVEIKRGAVRIGSLHRHLGRSGVLRFSKELNGEPGGRLVVRILPPKRERAGCPSRRLVLFPG
jgi:hypothetical protein